MVQHEKPYWEAIKAEACPAAELWSPFSSCRGVFTLSSGNLPSVSFGIATAAVHALLGLSHAQDVWRIETYATVAVDDIA